MKRSRLKNIISKSKSVSNKQEIGNSFELFKKSLPIEIDDNYRLETAWKAYGKPSDYKSAIWEGLIEPETDGTFKLPSIGYNEETDEYEYLNSGKDNEIVAKDIRVWDNDVIPLVQELKLGGYVRLFNEEKNCWTYTKNSQKRELPVEDNELQVIDSFLKGRKSKSYQEWVKTVPLDRLSDNYDLETAYQYLPIEELEKWRTATPEQLKDDSYHLRSVAPYGNGDYIFLKKGREWINPEVNGELLQYHLGKTGLLFSHDLIFDENQNRYFYKQKKGFNPQAFKQGGAVIPSGSLHAHKNHMELASEGLITPKGIPVISKENGEILLLAEIEREEVIFDKQATNDIEKLYKKFNETDKESEKDGIAIKAGKILTDIFINNTLDNTGLIEKVAEKNNLEYTK